MHNVVQGVLIKILDSRSGLRLDLWTGMWTDQHTPFCIPESVASSIYGIDHCLFSVY